MGILDRKILRTGADWERAEREPLDVVQRRQTERLLDMARYAFTTTDFYRDLYAARGISWQDLHDPLVATELPMVTKQDLRDHGDSMCARGVARSRVLHSSTGGSTGHPVHVLHDRDAPVAAMWRQAYRWWGVSPAENTAVVYRQVRRGRAQVMHRARWWPTSEVQLDAFRMDPEAISRFVDRCRITRPVLLHGYVNAVMEVAAYLEQRDVRLPSVRACAVTAAPLTPPQRSYLERVLAVPVYDCYRTAEVPWIAVQCTERDGLHVLAETRIVEIVDPSEPDGNGERWGEVTVTDLANRVQPIIRYRIGDRSARMVDGCGCGRSLPRIRPLHGRQTDVLRSPGGRAVTGGLGALFSHGTTAVSQFQVHQRADYSVHVRCVPGADLELARWEAEDVARQIGRLLDDEVPVSVDLVDRIDHIGGKMRVVTSDVTTPDGGNGRSCA